MEFWDFAEVRSTAYHTNGILRVLFYNEEDIEAYLNRFGYPDLFINHGTFGRPFCLSCSTVNASEYMFQHCGLEWICRATQAQNVF